MRFRLVIQHPIRPRQQISLAQLHELRRHIHPQMKRLWDHPPLEDSKQWIRELPPVAGDIAIMENHGNRRFVPLITQKAALTCSLEVTFLRHEAPGNLIYHGGDIDNRIKTLFDALSCPPPGQVPNLPPLQPDEDPLYCLLQDDRLITDIKVETDRLLTSDTPHDTLAIVKVTLQGSKTTFGNLSLLTA